MLTWDQSIKLSMLLCVLSAHFLMRFRLGSLAKAGRIPRSTLGMFKVHHNVEQWSFLLSGRHRALRDPLTTCLVYLQRALIVLVVLWTIAEILP